MTQKIFVISGLGADHAVFHKLDLPGYELVHVNWVPTTKGESLGAYAKRLLPQITDENPILLANIFDMSGINTVGNGIGHDITAVLDGNTADPYVLNDFYEKLYSFDDFFCKFP